MVTIEAFYDAERGTWTSEFTNHRVLMGPKGDCEAVKNKIDEVLGTETDKKELKFTKINERVQFMGE